MHFCWDELQVILFGLPFLGMILLWMRSTFNRLSKKLSRESECCHEHIVADLPINAHKIGHLGEVPGTCVKTQDKS